MCVLSIVSTSFIFQKKCNQLMMAFMVWSAEKISGNSQMKLLNFNQSFLVTKSLAFSL